MGIDEGVEEEVGLQIHPREWKNLRLVLQTVDWQTDDVRDGLGNGFYVQHRPQSPI